MLLGCAEGSLQVVVGVGLGKLAEVHKIRPGQGHRAAGSKQAPEPVCKQGERHPHLSPTQVRGTTQPRRKGKHVPGACTVKACVNRDSCIFITVCTDKRLCPHVIRAHMVPDCVSLWDCLAI